MRHRYRTLQLCLDAVGSARTSRSEAPEYRPPPDCRQLEELVRGMQVADAQLRMHEDTLKVLAVGRQSLAMQLNEKLKTVTPLPEGQG